LDDEIDQISLLFKGEANQDSLHAIHPCITSDVQLVFTWICALPQKWFYHL